MDERACANCVKRHPVGDHLECRARPPVPDVGRYGRYPAVRPDFYCHDGFVAAPPAAPVRGARKAQAAEPSA